MAEISTYTTLAASAIDRTADFIFVRDATGPSGKKATPQGLFDANLQGSHALLGDMTINGGAFSWTLTTSGNYALTASNVTVTGTVQLVLPLGASATIGQPLVLASAGTSGLVGWADVSERFVDLSMLDDANTTRTLAATDQGRTIRFTSSTAVSVSVPATLPDGWWCRILQFGAGKVTPAGTLGATVRGPQNQVATGHQFSTVTISKVATNEFVASGHVGA